MAALQLVNDEILPVLPLRDLVLFPHSVKSFFVGRQASIEAVNTALAGNGKILVVTQLEAGNGSPMGKDLYPVGTMGRILQNNKLEDNMIKVALRGLDRAKIVEYLEPDQGRDFLAARYELLRFGDNRIDIRLRDRLFATLRQYASLNNKFPKDQLDDLEKSDDVSRITDVIANQVVPGVEERQMILSTVDLVARVELVLEAIDTEIEKAGIDRDIKKHVKKQMEKNQREYYLNEKMKAIQKELGQDSQTEMDELAERIKVKKLPEPARVKAEAELKKLKQMSPMSAEATVVRTYLDWVLALPWEEYKEISIELKRIKEKLDEDHYGLEDVKDRILEHLAVHHLSGDRRGPKICFVGPPGVGKTSLARSIAESMEIDYIRQSLGGVRDEAEIRGHRRTYIGALPGRIIQGLRKSSSSNPLFLLDEIDKLGTDFRGDPSSALLEVLDPEQNHTFMDHYLDMEYDLSKVFFLATSNSLQPIPSALLDRMEVITLEGYTEEEKKAIALRHLIPRQMSRHGLEGELQFTRGTLNRLIRSYTREAGVRGLERSIEKILRKIAREKVEIEENKKSYDLPKINAELLQKFLGAPRYDRSDRDRIPLVGVANGLAWTASGGELLDIEVNLVPGSGRLNVTGKLGDVMKESAQAALSVVRKRADKLGVDQRFYRDVDIHIHVPEGAVPKDGPSAGITIATALTSELIGLPVREALAMTGEITLRGRVLPIGGLKEKVLAAVRNGIKIILIPMENEVDLEKISDDVLKQVEIIPVATIDEVFNRAFALADEMPLYEFLETHPPEMNYLHRGVVASDRAVDHNGII